MNQHMLRYVLIFSVGLNAVLAWSLVHRRPVSVPAAPSTSRPFPPPLAGKLTNSEPTVTFVTNRFHWRQLESADYERFVANLRAAGCPENTLRDIVVADVRKLYAHKLAALPLPAGFWTGGAARQEADKERLKKQEALVQEQEALLQRLLGPAYRVDAIDDNEVADEFTWHAIMRFLVGPVPENAYRRVNSLMRQWDEQAREIQRQSGSFLLPNDHRALADLRVQKMYELRQVLTPEQMQEFAERVALITHEETGLENVSLSADTWHRVAKLRVDVYGPFDREGPPQLFSNNEQNDPVRDPMFLMGLQSILGEKDFAIYQRENDEAFASLKTAAQQNGLPEGAAIKVYDIKQALEAENRRLREVRALEPGVLQARLDDLQRQARDEVAAILGKAYQSVLGQNAWLTNRVGP